MSTTPRSTRTRLGLVVLVLAALVTPTVALADGSVEQVIVQAMDADHAAELVASHGGRVDRHLQLVGGVAATLPAPAVAVLSAMDGVDVVPDEVLGVTDVDFVATATSDAGELPVQLAAMNPPVHWTDAAITDGDAEVPDAVVEVPASGADIGVALLDTGVDDHPALAGRVVHALDLSDEDVTDAQGQDSYGHGTFMAGLIAADGLVPGVAPGAQIVSIKLAGADGLTTLSRVIEGIGWVVTDEANNIRVMNLSFGVRTNRAPQADPLAAAVEAAWAAGIVVVAAAGNEGEGEVTSPGRDPWIITVGSIDTTDSADPAEVTVPDWSGSARVGSVHKPDVLAPGVSVLSLRAASSTIDTANEQARRGPDGQYFVGSGTSMSAALVSGAVAVLIENRPYATPDDVKSALVATGHPVAGSHAVAVDIAEADAVDGDVLTDQRFPIALRGVNGLQGTTMPWADRRAPGSEVTWERVRWADLELARWRWAESEWSRWRWAESEWSRWRWAESEWSRWRWAMEPARVRWADVAPARWRWADASFTRVRWADVHLTRWRWADSDWARVRWAQYDDLDSWARVRWATVTWGAGEAP